MNAIYNALRESWPSASDAALDEILWLTPYPAADVEVVIASITALHRQYGADHRAVIEGEYKEFDRLWREHKERSE